MDELDALKLLRGDNAPKEENDQVLKEVIKKQSTSKLYVAGALCGLLLFVILFGFVMHPIDHLALKFLVFDNYTITIKSGGTTQKLYVDGDVVFDGTTYYTQEEDGSIYAYRQDSYGIWRKFPETTSSSADTSWLARVISKDNYTREFFPWMPMKMNIGILGLENVHTQVTLGGCIITSQTRVGNGFTYWWSYTTITIGEFGFVNLNLPETYN